jgi:hypothetical protein
VLRDLPSDSRPPPPSTRRRTGGARDRPPSPEQRRDDDEVRTRGRGRPDDDPLLFGERRPDPDVSNDDRRGQGTRPRSEQASNDGRVPPHDFDAELSLLGAAMLSGEALEVLAKRVRPEDFYRPSHQHVAAAAVELYEEGHTRGADPVILADRLRQHGTLDHLLVHDLHDREAHGLAALLTIQSATPSTSSAPRYAAIVHDLATLRRVIAAAGEIAELGYSRGGPFGDAHEAVIRAQALVADVAANNGARAYSSLDFGDLEALLAGTLEPETPEFLLRNDGQALLYAGKVHTLQGEPSSGKSWLALLAVLEVLRMGGAALYLDYEDSLRGIVGRLLALGADPAAIRERFLYVKPDGPFTAAEKTELAGRLRTLNPDLAVIDGVAEALTRDGLSEDKATEFVEWFERLPRWLSRLGISVVLLDHVAKDKEGRGRWGRGTGAKLGAIDGAVYEVIVRTPFSRKRAGSIDLRISKDRPGGVGEIGGTAASCSITPHADGERVVLELTPKTDEVSKADSWKPTILMRKITDELERAEELGTPVTAKAISSLVHSEKKKLVSEALQRLILEGYVRTVRMGSAELLRLVKPYREGEEPPPRPAPPEELPLDGIDPPEAEPIGDVPGTNIVRGPWTTDYDRDRDRWPDDPGPDNEG